MANKGGVDDLVLLDEITENAILETLKGRYNADNIYTYIGTVLISVNPYRFITDMYGARQVKVYSGRYIYEEPPHVYGIAESAYSRLLSEGRNQAILITGESGAGILL